MSDETYNAAVDLLERNDAPGRREHAYLLTADRTWTYEEVIAGVRTVAAGFTALGLDRGDRVLLVLDDRPELVIAFWAAVRAGLVAVLSPPGLAPAELEAISVASAARVLVYDESSRIAASAVIASAPRPGLDAVVGISVDDADGGRASWQAVWASESGVGQAPPAETREQDIAFMLCTSGTTGSPKLVMHTHGGLRHAPRVLDAQVVGLGAGDVVLSVSKMSFSYGLGNSLYTPAAAGAAVALLSGPAVPAIVHTRLAGSAVTVLYGVPSFWRSFTLDVRARLPPSLRLALSAGETLDTELLHAVRGRFGIDVLDGYGMSETLQHVTCNRPGDVVPGSCGRVLDGFDIRVVDRSGRDVRDGRRGELWVAGATVSVGCWGRADLTERSRAGGWLRTGDLMRVRDGHLFHDGRRDDLMKINGRWVAPTEIEAVVRRHPDVRDVVVVERSHPSGLTSLWGYVVTDRADDLIGAELTELCRHLSPHKVPRGWQRCSALPRTRTGKLRRLDLRQAEWS